MKKISIVLATLMLVLGGCASGKAKETLKVYNWGEYIDQNTIRAFEKKYDAKVTYTTFDSNETMYTKLQTGEVFDVLVPSDYMVQRLIAENQLQTIDTSALTNYSGIVSTLLNQEYDPQNQYSVPYFWGNVGLVYNKNSVSLDDLNREGWGILKDPAYQNKIFTYNSERDSFMMALKNLGYSMNTVHETQIKAAADWLIDMDKKTSPIYGGDEIIDNMINGTKDLAVMYSGDATYIISNNSNMDYFVPNEGTNIWADAMVIPKNAENPDLAMKWIDFMLDPEIAYNNSAEVGYTSSVQSAIDAITAADGDYAGISSYVPRTDNAKDEYFVYNRDTAEIMSRYWSDVIAQ